MAWLGPAPARADLIAQAIQFVNELVHRIPVLEQFRLVRLNLRIQRNDCLAYQRLLVVVVNERLERQGYQNADRDREKMKEKILYRLNGLVRAFDIHRKSLEPARVVINGHIAAA